MKVLMISCGIDNKYGAGLTEYNKCRQVTPLLALPYLAAVTPPHISLQVIDEMNGLITDFPDADLVAISGMTMHANRMYRIGDYYRSRGITVVMGGIHVSYMEEEALQHCDSVLIGEGEYLWPELLKDFENQSLKKVYKSTKIVDISSLPWPRLDLVDGPAYMAPHGSLNSIMTTRGCPNSCDFCCVKNMFGNKFRSRKIDDVIAEITQMSRDPIMFADDNLTANYRYVTELCNKLIPLKRTWAAQASLRVAETPELLQLLYKAGCRSLFLGIETLSQQNLEDVNKSRVNKITEYETLIKRIKDSGIKIVGSFIVGLDNDSKGVFDDIYEFVVKNGIDFPIVNILTPFPGTKLYSKLFAENRIVDFNWDKYNLTQTVFTPAKMSREELQYGYNSLFYELSKHQKKLLQMNLK